MEVGSGGGSVGVLSSSTRNYQTKFEETTRFLGFFETDHFKPKKNSVCVDSELFLLFEITE